MYKCMLCKTIFFLLPTLLSLLPASKQPTCIHNLMILHHRHLSTFSSVFPSSFKSLLKTILKWWIGPFHPHLLHLSVQPTKPNYNNNYYHQTFFFLFFFPPFVLNVQNPTPEARYMPDEWANLLPTWLCVCL